jgi:hypothetical protein
MGESKKLRSKKEGRKMKKLILTGVLCLSTLGILSAKSYDITLTNPTQAGDVQLKAGDYRMKVEGGTAVFTDVNSNKQFSVPVKVENSDSKFSDTAVITTNQGGVDRIQEIDLGGSHTKLEVATPGE